MHIILVVLSLFSAHRRGPALVGDLDVALAGVQVGLEKKRQRWLLFLIEKEEHCMSQMAQSADLDRHEQPSGNHVWSIGVEAQDAYGS